jgi:hypothetical protein
MVTPPRSLRTAFGRFFVACVLLVSATGAHAAELAVGKSERPHDIDLAITLGMVQIEYVDQGVQPNGIRNRNRPLSANLRLDAPAWHGLTAYALAGVNTTVLSHNGSGNGYRMAFRQSLGWDVGAGLECQIAPHWAVRGQYITFRQMQSDHPNNEWFSYGSVSIVYTF